MHYDTWVSSSSHWSCTIAQWSGCQPVSSNPASVNCDTNRKNSSNYSNKFLGVQLKIIVPFASFTEAGGHSASDIKLEHNMRDWHHRVRNYQDWSDQPESKIETCPDAYIQFAWFTETGRQAGRKTEPFQATSTADVKHRRLNPIDLHLHVGPKNWWLSSFSLKERCGIDTYRWHNIINVAQVQMVHQSLCAYERTKILINLHSSTEERPEPPTSSSQDHWRYYKYVRMTGWLSNPGGHEFDTHCRYSSFFFKKHELTCSFLCFMIFLCLKK